MWIIKNHRFANASQERTVRSRGLGLNSECPLFFPVLNESRLAKCFPSATPGTNAGVIRVGGRIALCVGDAKQVAVRIVRKPRGPVQRIEPLGQTD